MHVVERGFTPAEHGFSPVVHTVVEVVLLTVLAYAVKALHTPDVTLTALEHVKRWSMQRRQTAMAFAVARLPRTVLASVVARLPTLVVVAERLVLTVLASAEEAQ